MDWSTQYHTTRARFWQKVEAFFDNLPPRLQQQGRLLRNNLAVHFSRSGDFSDILSRRDDYPQLGIPFWILDDCGFQGNTSSPKLADHLLSAAFFTFCTIYTQEEILDESSFFDYQYLYLANTLSQQADRHFGALFPPRSPFWVYHQKFWGDYAEALLSNLETPSKRFVPDGSEDPLQRKNLLAPYKLLPTTALLLADREIDLVQLFVFLDHLHKTILILRDLTHLKPDLALGRITYPILKLMLGVEPSADMSYSPEGAYVALMLTDIPSKLIQECLENLDSCRVIAKSMGLNRLLPFLNEQEIRALKINDQFLQSPESIVERDDTPNKITLQGLKSLDQVNLLEKALDMAERYLLSDLTFKDSWEVHRYGMAGVPEVISRFPAGLVIEVLCSHGFEMSVQVDEFYKHFRKCNYSYYNHPDLPYADTDTLGVLLRLHRYSKNQDTNRTDLDKPLDWMQKSIEEAGRIPVWIYPPKKSRKIDDRSVRLLGEGCGTIEANLLLGLIDFEWESYKEIVQASARQLLYRFIQQGSGITVNYSPLYCLWRINQLNSRLEDLTSQETLKALIVQFFAIYAEQFAKHVKSFTISPQQAALLMLASINSPAQKLFDKKWVRIILKNQHSDGSWYGEPIFFVPNRGGATTWHTSRTLTTAFCYHALRTYSKVNGELHP
jgi:hypothetical protein